MKTFKITAQYPRNRSSGWTEYILAAETKEDAIKQAEKELQLPLFSGYYKGDYFTIEEIDITKELYQMRESD